MTKLDRLTRSVRDLGDLVAGPFAAGRAALLSVSEQIDTRSAAGRLVLNVLASVSQWEREAIGERTSIAMRHMRASNRYTGGRAPYGYALEGDELVPVDAEQEVIRRARELRASGLSFRKIAAVLHSNGHRSRAGHAFAPQQVARLVASS